MSIPERFSKRHYSPIDVYGQDAVDWQERVNFPRLREQRLERTREFMRKADIPALLLFTGDNIRYALGAYQGHWKYAPFIRYAVVPLESDPYLFELANIDYENALLDAPWLADHTKPAIAWRMTEAATEEYLERMVDSVIEILRGAGINGGPIGLDAREPEVIAAFARKGYEVRDGQSLMMAARVIKFPDELELLKQGCAIGDAMYWNIKYRWLEPGVKERDIAGEMASFLFKNGFEHISQIFVASGGNSNPYKRWFSDKIINFGDFVVIDINAAGIGGYYIDYVRTLLVGDRPTQEQKDNYKQCYDMLMATIDIMGPGVSTSEVAAMLPADDDDKLRTVSLVSQAHAIGLSLADGRWVSRGFSLEYPTVLEPGMVFAVETIASNPGGEQSARLEDNVVITDDGCKVFSRFEYELSCLS